jgi:hypothetical protein
MKIKKPKLLITLIILFSLTVFIQCFGMIHVDLNSVGEWIEGKAYPVTVTFDKLDRVSNVVLHYSFNGQPETTTPLTLQGTNYVYTIPADEVVAGNLNYYVTFIFDENEEVSDNVTVKVLTIEEAIAKFKKELLSRLSHNAPKEVAFNKPVDLTLTVSNVKSSTEVTFYYKTSQQNNYQESKLSGSNGNFTYQMSKQQLDDGYNTYYYQVKEIHEDVGELVVTLPEQGASSPFTYNILGADELREKMTAELSQSIEHRVPKDVYVIYDLEIKATVRYANNSFIKQLSKDNITMSIHFGKDGKIGSFKEAEMAKYQNNVFTYTMPASDLKAGYNSYYFEISDNTEDVGKVEAFYPKDGESKAFIFNTLSVEEIKAIMEKELYNRISHTPVKESDGISELKIKLGVKDASYNTQAYIHIKKPNQTNYRTVSMSRSNETFNSSISIEDQQNGYTQYYFTVTEVVDEIGELAIDYPKDGLSKPFTYKVLDINEVQKKLEDSLRSRFKHTPVTQAAEGQALDIVSTVENMVDGTEVYLYHRKSGESSFRSTKAKLSGNTFTATISKQDIRNGYNQYYLEAREPHHYFNVIKATNPKDGASSPYTFEIATLRDSIYSGIEFTNLPDVNYGDPVKVNIKFNYIVSGMDVYLKYRVSGETQYSSLQMIKSGSTYSTQISQSLLQEGNRIDYYFMITIDSENISFTYPNEDIIPLSFVVNETAVETKYYKVNTNVSPSNAGKIILTPEASENKYKENTGIVATAAGNEGFTFDHWEGDISGSDNPAVLTVNSDKNITAVFTEVETGEETPFGNTEKTESNMLEGKIYQLPEGTNMLPSSLHSDYDPLTTIYTRKIDIPERSFTEGFPGLENVFEWFAIQYRGLIVIKEYGEYKFKLKSDDGSKLYIDSELVIDNDGTHGPKAVNGKITLSPGTYPIRIDYFQGPRDKIALQFYAKKPNEGEKIFDLADYE